MFVIARNVYGDPLLGPFTVELERLGMGARLPRSVARDVPPSGRAEFAADSAGETYRLRASAEGHRAVSRIVNGTTGELEVRLPVAPSAVRGFSWPDPMPQIPGVDWPHEFGVLGPPDDGRRRALLVEEPVRIATLLNIWAKLWHTYIGVTPAAAFVDEVLEVRVDRIIARMSAGLLDAIEGDDDLDVVTSAVGHEPPAGYDNGVSIKTRDAVGNLQISTFVAEGRPLLADIDIDEERGLVHLFRVVGHLVTGDKTEAVDIGQILYAEEIDPGWRPLLV